MTTPITDKQGTPLTDAAEFYAHCEQDGYSVYVVKSSIARELELRVQELEKALRELLDNYKANGGKGLGIGPLMKARAALGGGE
jgi:hypothetical protein